MFKKVILVIISLAAAGALGYYLSTLVRDKATSPEALPDNVLAFISEHFQNEKIAFAKEDRDLLKMSYEVLLTDGTKLEFRRSGEWKEISRYRTGIPEGIIPQPAVVKVNDLYPQACIVKAEYDDGDLELELDNGMELKFDKRLNMIGLDR